MVESIGREGEDGAGHDCRGRVVGEIPDEQEDAEAARRETGEHQCVQHVDDGQAGPDSRCGNHALEEDRVGKREGERERGEDVRVEQLQRIAR